MNKNFYLQPAIVSLLDPDGAVVSKNVLPGCSALQTANQNIDHDFATPVFHAKYT